MTAGARFYNALELIKRVVNLGDSKSLACHPASTTHRQMSPAEQIKAGVTPEMIRMSIGIEHIDDILADLDHALDYAVSTGVGGRPAVAAHATRPVEQVTIS
jgi:O-acetylhomoserine (thiol)-lyase